MVHATDLNVPADYATIQEAIDAASDGDTVIVAPGLYVIGVRSQFLGFNYSGKNITVTSLEGPEKTFLDVTNGGESIVSEGNHGGALSGFTIKYGSFTPIRLTNSSLVIEDNIFRNTVTILSVIDINSGSPVIRNNIFRNIINDDPNDNAPQGIINVFNAVGSIIEDNLFENNQSPAVSTFNGGNVTVINNRILNNTVRGCGAGIRIRGSGNIKIIQNIIYNNQATEGAGGVCLKDNGNVKLLNNTIYNNSLVSSAGSDASEVFIESSADSIEFVNNIISGAEGYPSIFCSDLNSGADQIYNSNNVYSLSSVPYSGVCVNQTGLNNNISSDPELFDPLNNLFYLTSGSQSINVGINSDVDEQAFDMLGQPRIMTGEGDSNFIIDLGALEYDPMGVIKLASKNVYVPEDATSFNLRGCLLGGSDIASANVTAIDGDASQGVDYSFINTSLNFNQSGCQDIPIALIDNTQNDFHKDFLVMLDTPTGVSGILGSGQTKINIIDNETDIELTTSTPSIVANLSPPGLDPFANPLDFFQIERVGLGLEVSEESGNFSEEIVTIVTFPSEIKLLSAQSGKGSFSSTADFDCEVHEPTVTCTFDELMGGDESITIGFWAETLLQDEITVSVTSEKNDVNSSNNSLTIPLVVSEKPVNLSLSENEVTVRRNGSVLQDTSKLVAGDTIIIVTNLVADSDNNDGNINDVVLTFNLPENVSYFPLNNECMTSQDGRTVNCTFDEVQPSNNSIYPSFGTRFRVDGEGDVNITASISSFGEEQSPLDNTLSYTSFTSVGIPIQNYFPLTPLTYYQALDNNLNIVDSFISDEFKTINGIQTTETLQSDSGPSYFTNNETGLFIHQELDTVGDGITYSPPAKILNALPQVGDFNQTTGTTTIFVSGLGTFNIPYNYRSRVVSRENITVPFGTFEALKVEINNDISGISGSYQIDLRIESTVWLVEGLGIVKEETTQSSFASSETRTYELQSVGGPPEISTPTNLSTLPNSSQIFNWINNGTPVTEWWLHFGSSLGAKDIINTGTLGTATSYTTNNLPTDGSTVYVRLFFRTDIAGWKSVDFSYQTTDLPLPIITGPADMSTLTGSSETFVWDDNGNYVKDWWLYLGSSVGAKNIYDSGSINGATLSQTINNLPTDGSTIYARLFFRGNTTTWKNADFTFTAFDAPAPMMTAPVDGATLTSGSETFSWDANGNAVTQWWFRLGTKVGGQEIYESGNLGATDSVTVNTLPTNGSTIYGRLFYRNGGGSWKHEDFTFTAFDAPAPMMIAPVNGAILTSGSETFSWDANGNAVTQWWFRLGTKVGGQEIYESGNLGATDSVIVNTLPTNGSTIYGRLFYRNGGGSWKSEDFTFTAFSAPQPILSPANASVLTSNSQAFSWVPNGNAVDEWWLYLGTSVGSNNLFDSGNLGAATNVNVNNLPSNGSTIYARLFYRSGGAGAWSRVDYTYTAFSAPQPIPTPANASVLTSNSQAFSWVPNGNAVDEWWLYLGTSVGSNNLFDSGNLGSATNVNVNNLPSNGSTIYARLFYRSGGVGAWSRVDYTYTAFSAPAPMMTSPLDGATLTSNSETFSWEPNGNAVTQWWFRLGTSLGGFDIYNSGNLGGTDSVTVNNLPTDGSTIYARLYYRNGNAGAWSRVDFTYTASD